MKWRGKHYVGSRPTDEINTNITVFFLLMKNQQLIYKKIGIHSNAVFSRLKGAFRFVFHVLETENAISVSNNNNNNSSQMQLEVARASQIL